MDIIIAKADQKRHGQKVIRQGAPYPVVGETKNHYQVKHRSGLHFFIDKDKAHLVHIINPK